MTKNRASEPRNIDPGKNQNGELRSIGGSMSDDWNNTLANQAEKGQQKVTVERVHVRAGGQAVVGTVERPGERVHRCMEEQPHAKQIAHAPEPPLLREDETLDAVPIARDAER